jgi:hypothetical protein
MRQGTLMSNLLNKILYSTPYPELFIRFVYYRIIKPLLSSKNSVTEKSKKPRAALTRHEAQEVAQKITLQELKDELICLGIHEGDILIVHSSAQSLNCLAATLPENINMLISLVGKSGTLAMPAYPDEKRLKSEDGM